MKWLIALLFLLSACEVPINEPLSMRTLGDSCSQSSECETPSDYLIQSNCPFQSACIDGVCHVVCPIWNQGSANYVVACEKNEDCDCSWRENRSLECICSSGVCLSVEA